MRAGGELTKEEFIEQKNRISGRITSFSYKSLDNDETFTSWLELSESYFNTAFKIKEIFDDGTADQKRLMLNNVGENYTLQDKKLTFSFKKPYDILI